MLWLKDLWCVNFAAYLQRGVLCLCEKKNKLYVSMSLAITVSKSLTKKSILLSGHGKGRFPKLGRCLLSWIFYTMCAHQFLETNIKKMCWVMLWGLSLNLELYRFCQDIFDMGEGGARSQACESSDHRLQWVDHPVQLNGPTHSSGVTFWAIFLAFCGSSSMFDWGLWSSHQCVWQLLLP